MFFEKLSMTVFLCTVRENLKDLTKQYDKSENDLKALQSVGQVSFKSSLCEPTRVALHCPYVFCISGMKNAYSIT